MNQSNTGIHRSFVLLWRMVGCCWYHDYQWSSHAHVEPSHMFCFVLFCWTSNIWKPAASLQQYHYIELSESNHYASAKFTLRATTISPLNSKDRSCRPCFRHPTDGTVQQSMSMIPKHSDTGSPSDSIKIAAPKKCHYGHPAGGYHSMLSHSHSGGSGLSPSCD